jgi:hypothetical protein
MLANSTLGGFPSTSRLGFFFDDSFLGEPPPPAPRMNPSLPMPGPINYDLPGIFLPPVLNFPAPPMPTLTPIRGTTPSTSYPSYPGAPTTLDRVSGIIANVVGAFATNRGFTPTTSGAYSDYARTQQTGVVANAAQQQQAAADAAVYYGAQGAGADTGANVGAAVGNIGDQIFGTIARHPFATLLVGAGAVLLFLPSPKRGR